MDVSLLASTREDRIKHNQPVVCLGGGSMGQMLLAAKWSMWQNDSPCLAPPPMLKTRGEGGQQAKFWKWLNLSHCWSLPLAWPAVPPHSDSWLPFWEAGYPLNRVQLGGTHYGTYCWNLLWNEFGGTLHTTAWCNMWLGSQTNTSGMLCLNGLKNVQKTSIALANCLCFLCSFIVALTCYLAPQNQPLTMGGICSWKTQAVIEMGFKWPGFLHGCQSGWVGGQAKRQSFHTPSPNRKALKAFLFRGRLARMRGRGQSSSCISLNTLQRLLS